MPPATSGPLQQQEARAGDGGEAEAEAEEGQGGLLGPFMAVHVAAGRVGVAWYDGATAEMRCMEGADETSGALRHRLVQLAKAQVAPAVVFVSSRADPELVAALREAPDGGGAGDGAAAAPPGCEVRVERASLFHPRQARACLEAVHLPGWPPGLPPRDRLHRLNATLALAAEAQVCAAGALLAALARDGLLAPDPSAPAAALPLASLEEAPLGGHLQVDPGSMDALGIFRQEAHPSAMGIGRAKEGLSAFGLLNRTVTPPGRRMLRLWFARPLVDLPALEARLDAVEALAGAEQAGALRALLRGVRDAPRTLARLQTMQTLPDPTDFLALQESLAATLRIRDALMELTEAPPRFDSSTEHATPRAHPAPPSPHQPAAAGSGARPPARAPFKLLRSLAEAIPEELVACHNLIAGVIDPSQAPDGLTVHYGVSPDLDELKAMYFGLPDLLAAVARHEAARLPPHSAAAAAAARGGWEVLYLPQVGFVLQAGGELLGSDVLESVGDYELAFDGGGGAGHAQHADFDGGRGVDVAAAGACYHTDTTRELTQRYGDLLLKVRDLEGAVCCQLAARLGASAGAVRAGAGAAAHLDCLLSLAGAAVELTLVRPRLVEEPVLRVRGGRHLLAEQLLPAGAFIPNDTRMGGADARLHVLTGPNLSGKSCYSRGVALIAFLAHVGSFVPADEAEVGVVDRIFTRVATREAASVPQSSFLIDLSQVAAMLRLATPRSLLIIDEFGKGTLASDGVGLVCGAAAHLAAAGAAGCPRALLCTHFTEVLDPGYLPRNPMMAFYTMGVVVEEEEGGERGRGRGRGDDTGGGGGGGGGGGLVFLYRILPGQVGPSFGVHCARAAGVDVSVLARAEEVIAAHARGEAPPQAAAPPALAARGAAFEGLVQGLLALDTRSAVDCRALVEAVAAATADA